MAPEQNNFGGGWCHERIMQGFQREGRQGNARATRRPKQEMQFFHIWRHKGARSAEGGTFVRIVLCRQNIWLHFIRWKESEIDPWLGEQRLQLRHILGDKGIQWCFLQVVQEALEPLVPGTLSDGRRLPHFVRIGGWVCVLETRPA